MGAALAAVATGCTHSPEILVCGTYTDSGSRGVYSLRFDADAQTLEIIDSVEAVNPSYVAFSPDKRMIYAVSENGSLSGVYSIEFDPATGRFGRAYFEKNVGADPCYVAVAGDYVVTADYSGGSLSFFQTDANGRLMSAGRRDQFTGCGPDTRRQASAHVHSAVVSPDERNMYVADLGSDRLYCYEISNGQLAIVAQTVFDPGFGPRMSAIAPDGRHVYVLGELSGEIAVFERDRTALRRVQTVVCDTLNERAAGDLHISRDGKYLYGSTRRRGDGIRVFAVGTDGLLSNCGFVPTAPHPRNFLICSDDKYVLVASRDANAIEVYRRDASTGILTSTDIQVRLPKPVCLIAVGRR